MKVFLDTNIFITMFKEDRVLLTNIWRTLIDRGSYSIDRYLAFEIDDSDYYQKLCFFLQECIVYPIYATQAAQKAIAKSKNQDEYSQSLNLLAKSFWLRGDFKQALVQYSKSLDLSKNIFGINHLSVAESYSHIGLILGDLGKYRDALKYHELSLSVRTRLKGQIVRKSLIL